MKKAKISCWLEYILRHIKQVNADRACRYILVGSGWMCTTVYHLCIITNGAASLQLHEIQIICLYPSCSCALLYLTKKAAIQLDFQTADR